MQIFIQTITGLQLVLDVETTSTIYELKCQINKAEGIPIEDIIILHNGRKLEDRKSIKEYNIRSDDTINIVLRMGGGLRILDQELGGEKDIYIRRKDDYFQDIECSDSEGSDSDTDFKCYSPRDSSYGEITLKWMDGMERRVTISPSDMVDELIQRVRQLSGANYKHITLSNGVKTLDTHKNMRQSNVGGRKGAKVIYIITKN